MNQLTRKTSWLLSLAPLAGLVPALAAPQSNSDVYSLPLGSVGNEPSVQRMLCGELSNDGVPDLVILQGKTIHLVVNPSWADSKVDGPTNVLDAVLVPGDSSGTHGTIDQDQLFTLTPMGLERLDFKFQDGGQLVPNSVLLYPELPFAKRLGSADLDGTGAMDLYVVGADGKTVWALYDGAGTQGAAPTPLFTTILPVDDLVVANLGAGQVPHFVVSTEIGLETFSITGTPVTFLLEPYGNGRVVKTRQTPGQVGQVTWLRHDGQGSKIVEVTAPFESTAPTLVPNCQEALGSGDFNLDGEEDLLVLQNAGTTLSVLLGSSNGFSPTQSVDTPTPAADAQQADGAGVYMGDLDNDGDPDLATFLPNIDKLFLVINNHVPAEASTPHIEQFQSQDRYWARGQSQFRVSMYFDQVEFAPVGANTIEATAWGSIPSEGATAFETDPSPRDHATVKISNGKIIGSNLVTLSLFDHDAIQENVAYITLRYLRIGEDGTTVEKVWPAKQKYLTGPNNDTALTYLANLSFLGAWGLVPTEDPRLEPYIGEGSEPGSGGDTPCCPDFPPGRPPEPPSGG